MDLATLIGVLGGLLIVILTMIIDGGSPLELIAHPQAIMLTFGGAFLGAASTVPLEVLMKFPKYVGIAFKAPKVETMETIELMARMADKARREGLLALEEEAKKINDEFLRRGIQLVVDGTDPAQVKSILELDISNMEERHHEGIGFFSQAGGFAPTFGIIGTVMGLISVLKELDNPSKLATSIAAAFLATLWGLLSANIVFMPIAGKLTTRNTLEVAYRRMLLEGILSLQAGENPRIIKEKLLAFVPPKERTEEGGKGKAEGAGEPSKAGGKA